MRRNRLIAGLLLFIPFLGMAQSLEIKPDKKGRLGYFDADGNKVISCQFEEAESFANGVARVRKDGKYGLINEKGKAIGGFKYTVMEEYADTDYYIVCEGGSEAKSKDKISSRTSIPSKIFKGSTYYPIKGAKWGVIDREGNMIIKPQYDELSDPINGVIYVSSGGKFGFYDVEKKKLVLKPTYNFIGAFNNLDVCWVKNGSKYSNGVLKGGKTSFINRDGKLIIPLKFEQVNTFPHSADPMESSLPIHSGQNSNNVLLSPFQPMPDSEEPYLWFATKGMATPGIVDVKGTIVLPEKKYNVVYKPTDGMVRFSTTEGKKRTLRTREGFFDIAQKKEYVTDSEYKFAPFTNGISKAMKKDSTLYYFVDRNLSEISDRYTVAGNFQDGYCTVGRAKKYGVVDHTGKEIIPLQYDGILAHFSEDLIGVKQDGKWGYITPHGEVAVPFVYDDVWTYTNGQAAVKQNGLIGVIDKKGEIVLPILWKDFKITETVPSAYYWVQKDDNLFYYYDMEKQQILFPKESKGYNDVWLFADKPYAMVKSLTFYGAVYRDGSECVPVRFDRTEDVEKALFYMQKNGLTTFKEVDLMRFKITLRGTCNSHSLYDRIPEQDWDY